MFIWKIVTSVRKVTVVPMLGFLGYLVLHVSYECTEYDTNTLTSHY